MSSLDPISKNNAALFNMRKSMSSLPSRNAIPNRNPAVHDLRVSYPVASPVNNTEERLYNKTSDITYNEIMKIFTKEKEMKSRENPLLVILYGPPGSGKSSSKTAVYKTYGLSSDDFIHIDIDEPLESTRNLREETRVIRESYPYNTTNAINKAGQLNKLTKEISKRRVVHMNGKVRWDGLDTRSENDGLYKWSIREKLHAAIQEALDRNWHIMLDMTGNRADEPGLEYQRLFTVLPEIYKVIVFYPFISYQTQKNRTFKRANEFMTKNPPYYGRSRTNEKRVEGDMKTREFFETTLLPMFFAGLIYKINIFNNELSSEPDFAKEYIMDYTSIPEERHNPLRRSAAQPVIVNSSGTLIPSEKTPYDPRERLAQIIDNGAKRLQTLHGGRRTKRKTRKLKTT